MGKNLLDKALDLYHRSVGENSDEERNRICEKEKRGGQSDANEKQ